MSLTEIIEELPKLTPAELAAVEAKLREIHRAPVPPSAEWGEALLEVAGTAEGLPADFAENHDHYLHGAPRMHLRTHRLSVFRRPSLAPKG